MCFFLFFRLGLPARGGHSLNKYCVMIYGSIFVMFHRFFSEEITLSEALGVLIFVARWRHNFCQIAVKN